MIAEARRSWAWDVPPAGKSGAWQGKTGLCWSSLQCDLVKVEVKTGWGRACEPAGTVEYYRQTYNGQTDTGGGVSGRGRAVSWVSCAAREPGSLECWMLQSCSERTHPNMRAQGWSDSPELETVQTGCELGSQEDSHWRTESDSGRTSCGWCAGDWTVL